MNPPLRDQMPTPGVLLQMVTQNDEKHEQGHHRLRTDYRELEDRVLALEETITTQASTIDSFRERRTDVSQITFSPSVVLAIITIILSVAGGMWASTYGLRSDVRDILTHMAAQKDQDVTTARLQEERANNFRDSIEAMKRRQELQQYEIQGIKELLVQMRKGR